MLRTCCNSACANSEMSDSMLIIRFISRGSVAKSSIKLANVSSLTIPLAFPNWSASRYRVIMLLVTVLVPATPTSSPVPMSIVWSTRRDTWLCVFAVMANVRQPCGLAVSTPDRVSYVSPDCVTAMMAVSSENTKSRSVNSPAYSVYAGIPVNLSIHLAAAIATKYELPIPVSRMREELVSRDRFSDSSGKSTVRVVKSALPCIAPCIAEDWSAISLCMK